LVDAGGQGLAPSAMRDGVWDRTAKSVWEKLMGESEHLRALD
jgi:hypothetical protein